MSASGSTSSIATAAPRERADGHQRSEGGSCGLLIPPSGRCDLLGRRSMRGFRPSSPLVRVTDEVEFGLPPTERQSNNCSRCGRRPEGPRRQSRHGTAQIPGAPCLSCVLARIDWRVRDKFDRADAPPSEARRDAEAGPARPRSGRSLISHSPRPGRGQTSAGTMRDEIGVDRRLHFARRRPANRTARRSCARPGRVRTTAATTSPVVPGRRWPFRRVARRW